MARPDPLESIMGMLRKTGSVDPNSVSARKAGMKTERQSLGASPPAKMMPPQSGGRGMPPDVMPHQAGIQQGVSPQMQEQPNMMGTIVDALNEAIIGLKTEIHRAADPERKKMLESEAQQIRERIVEMGGEPIWADESIEEGLQKLRGLGVKGVPYMDGIANQVRQGPAMQAPQAPVQQGKAGKQEQPVAPGPPSPSMALSSLFQKPSQAQAPVTPPQRATSYYGGWFNRRGQQGVSERG